MKTKGVFDFKFVVPSAIFFSILLSLALSVGQGFPFATSFEEWLSDGAAKDIFPFSSRMLVPEGEVPSRKKNGADIERAVRGDRRRRNGSTELSGEIERYFYVDVHYRNISSGYPRGIFIEKSSMDVCFESSTDSFQKNGADIERAVRGDRRRRNDSTELSYLDGAVEHLKYPIV